MQKKKISALFISERSKYYFGQVRNGSQSPDHFSTYIFLKTMKIKGNRRRKVCSDERATQKMFPEVKPALPIIV